MTHPRRRGALLLSSAAALALVGCGGAPTTKTFADKAVSFIEGDMAKNTQLNGLTFTEATCQEPTTKEIGTEFSCTATGSDGAPRTITAKIVGRNSLQITKIDPSPLGDATTATTAPAAATTVAAPPPTTG